MNRGLRVSRAAREPRSGSDLPLLDADGLIVAEAFPDPPPGPLREQLVAANETRVRAAQDALRSVLQSHLTRSLEVILARVRGPKARKGTRWWVTETKGDDSPQRSFRTTLVDHPLETEVKSLDPDYVVPAKLTDGLASDLQPVALNIAMDAALDVSHRLGDDGGLGDFDVAEIEQAVEDIVGRILGVAERHAREVRAAVLDIDRTAGDLDEVLDRIEAAHRKGGNWLLMSGGTLANALINDAALREAIRLGVTHVQWISRRDDRVRPTHVDADGQVRRTGDHFHVGRFHLLHPGDPIDLPESWEEIAGCRCGLRFRKPDKGTQGMLDLIFNHGFDAAVDADGLLRAAAILASAAPETEVLIPAPEGLGLPPVASVVSAGEPIVGFRVLDRKLNVVPGQRISLPGALTLGLASSATATAVTLAVAIPAGVAVGYAAGTVILPEGTVLEILGAGADGVSAVVLA